MVVRHSKKEVNALLRAAKARSQGLQAQVYRTKKGYSISTTRN